MSKLQRLVDKVSAEYGGIKIIRDNSDGGKYGYVPADAPDVTIFGFKTRKSAYEHWLQSKLGPQLLNALLEIMSETAS